MLKINPHLCSPMVIIINQRFELHHFPARRREPTRREGFYIFSKPKTAVLNSTSSAYCWSQRPSSYWLLVLGSLSGTGNAVPVLLWLPPVTHFHHWTRAWACCLLSLDNQLLPFFSLSGQNEKNTYCLLGPALEKAFAAIPLGAGWTKGWSNILNTSLMFILNY